MCLEDQVLLQLSQHLVFPELEQAQRHLAACTVCKNRLLSLLRSQLSQVSFTDSPDFVPQASPSTERPVSGQSVGRYVLLGLIGSGGMGVVCSAYDPTLDRKVALKFIHADASHPDAPLRLLREAQAIAKLSHPNVITVYEVGAAGDEVFMSVELVKGPSLRQWLAASPRHWKETLRVFIEAGNGLAAAHAAGLVHRDFKPDNVLVGEDGRVRVTDFGLARSFRGSRVDEPVALEERSGTLPYMSPEQLSGGEADAQSDQFAFCVSLHEALYGTRPFEGEKKKAIPAWLQRIVLRGLSASAEQRYPSMNALLSALEAHSISIRRRRLVLGILAAAAALAIFMVSYARSVRPSCDQAASALTGVWDGDRKAEIQRAFGASKKPFAADAWRQTARELDRYASQWVRSRVLACRAAQKKAELPDVTALRALCLDERLQEFRATTQLMMQPDAEAIASAVEISQRLSPIGECDSLSSLAAGMRIPSDPKARPRVRSLRSKLAEVEVLQRFARFKDAHALIEPLLEEARKLNDAPFLVDTLVVYARLQLDLGDPKSSEKTPLEALRVALEAGYERGAAKATEYLVYLVGWQTARPQEAHVWAEQAAAHIVRLGGDPLLQAELLANEGVVYNMEGQFEKAMALLTQALSAQEQVLGGEHLTVAKTLNKIGFVHYALSHFSEAIASVSRAIEIETKLLGPKNPQVAMHLSNLGAAYVSLQRFPEAIRTIQQSVDVLQESLGPDHIELASPLLNLGRIAALEGRYSDGLNYLKRSEMLFEKAFGPDDPKISSSLDWLGIIRLNQGRLDDAMHYFQRELTIGERSLGPKHPNLVDSLVGMAGVYCEQQRLSLAVRALNRALSIGKGLPQDHESLGFISDRFGQLWLAMGQAPRAIPEFQRALDISRRKLGEDSPEVGDRLAHLGIAYLRTGELRLALPVLERANQIGSRGVHDPTQLAVRQFALSKALALTNREPKRASELGVEARQLLNRSRAEKGFPEKEIALWLGGAMRLH